MSTFSHLDKSGQARMVDVGNKPETNRFAKAKCEIIMQQNTFNLIRDGSTEKGNIFAVSKIAGVMAAKKTSELIPLCHPIEISSIAINIHIREDLPGFEIEAIVKSTGKTGVEMEALTAASLTALSIYDMVKAVEKTLRIDNLRLVEKRGGQSGDVLVDS